MLRKLDYIASLGVNTIWLLPFYPSPGRDDGYDISDYRSISPEYGSIEDFSRLVEAAHSRGIRIIIELVVNHTSDEHPWFQRARRAPEGSIERDYYVWSDTTEKFADTRIIFVDSQTSNWSWDPVACAYYWHRFYAHQPDLNFRNPAVVDELLAIMRFWLEKGVDGFRLDAIPHLIERENTSSENLPETHQLLKQIRRVIDTEFPDAVLLAEANLWPDDAREYFGDGDECHMAFHFPLMPRLFMALAKSSSGPIRDIMEVTLSIPSQCQWAIFLRNHDELTLEMVSEEEREFLWDTFAADKRARLNLGIRRRLSPLLDQDRRRIELLHILLLSLPGSPVLYYGDEIGMGDNIALGDRDGVRTPMQWSADENAGFSTATPSALDLPVIVDPHFNYQAINVDQQDGDQHSLLNWIRERLCIRHHYPAFARGGMDFVEVDDHKVVAYVRSLGDQHILCVINLANQPLATSLILSDFEGFVPKELVGGQSFPAVAARPYTLTLQPYAYFWLLLEHRYTC